MIWISLSRSGELARRRQSLGAAQLICHSPSKVTNLEVDADFCPFCVTQTVSGVNPHIPEITCEEGCQLGSAFSNGLTRPSSIFPDRFDSLTDDVAPGDAHDALT
jgi:hypothetical protein